jgi:ABC-type sugar transport system permease subunit
MLTPTLLLLTAFFIVPIGVAAFESFFAWDLLTPPRYVGVANYQAIAAHGALLGVGLRTLAYSVLVVSGTLALGLALALVVDRPGNLFALVRASIFSAYVVSWVAVALLWMALLDDTGGIVTRGLRAVGLGRVSLLGDPRAALPTLAAVGIWKLTGYSMIVFLSGLQSIPPSLHEAAALDGAGPWARFRYVTLPALAPTVAFVATTMLVTSFQAFDIVRIVTQGGPARATRLFVYAIYEEIFLDLRVGRASALTVVFFAVLLALASFQVRSFRASGRSS